MPDTIENIERFLQHLGENYTKVSPQSLRVSLTSSSADAAIFIYVGENMVRYLAPLLPVQMLPASATNALAQVLLRKNMDLDAMSYWALVDDTFVLTYNREMSHDVEDNISSYLAFRSTVLHFLESEFSNLIDAALELTDADTTF